MKLGTKKVLGGFVALLLCVPAEVIGYLAANITSSDETLGSMVGAVVCSAIAVLMLGGARAFVPRSDAHGMAWHLYGWSVVVSLGLCAAELIYATFTATPVVDGWQQQLVWTIACMLLVGLSEELMFRGLLFSGLLARFGTTKRGILGCVMATALIFGLAHIDLATLNVHDPSQLVQAVLKVLQTGIAGLALATSVASGSGLLWPAALHATDNLLLFIPAALFDPNISATVNYVSTGEDALLNTLTYVGICVLYIPIIVRSVRQLKALEAPALGPFMPEGAGDPAEPADDLGGLPPAPSGFARVTKIADAQNVE